MKNLVNKLIIFAFALVIVISGIPIKVNAASQTELESEYKALWSKYTNAVKKHAEKYSDEVGFWDNPKGCDTTSTFTNIKCITNSLQTEGVKRADKEFKDEFDKMKKKYEDNGMTFNKPNPPFPKATMSKWDLWAQVKRNVDWGEPADVTTKVEKSAPKKVLIASQGMFTKTDVKEFGGCDVSTVKEQLKGQVGEPKVVDTSQMQKSDSSSSDSSSSDDSKEDKTKEEDKKSNLPALPFLESAKDKIGQAMSDTFKRFTDDIQGNLFGTDCDNNTLSVIGQFLNISRPLNVTDNQYVMKLVHVTQQIAFTMSIVIIAFYALMYTTGFHNMDPVKFGVRLFFCLLAVNYLPWLMQDVLNLNNEIVYNVSTLEFTFDNSEGNSTELIMGAFTAIFESFVTGENVGKSLLLLIFAFIMAIVAIVPMLKIITWWYIRLLRLFLAAVVGPMLVVLGALPQTADKAQKWLNAVIGQIFQQVFVALGLILVAVIVGNIGDFGDTLNIGWFGRGILIYACIFFLADVPSFANQFLEGLKGGKADSIATDMMRTGKKTRKAATGAAIGGAAMGIGLSGKDLPNKGIRGMVMNGKAAKKGHIIGKSGNEKAQMVGRGIQTGVAGAKARAGNFKTGYKTGFVGDSVNSPQVKGASGIAGAIAGRAVNQGNKAYNNVVPPATKKMGETLTAAKQKAGDARVTTQLAASMGAAAAGNAINHKKDNLKEAIKNLPGNIEKRAHNKIEPTMQNMYKEAYGKDMKSVNEESARKIGNVANSRVEKGANANTHQQGGVKPSLSSSSPINSSLSNSSPIISSPANSSTNQTSNNKKNPPIKSQSKYKTERKPSENRNRTTVDYNPTTLNNLHSGYNFTLPETPNKKSTDKPTEKPTKTPKRNEKSTPPDNKK
ncbi:hypothetical protein CN918_27555 [Priestia megaterium]|nr:hypothetical protein CN918_27555 [Priestia megaterium]